MVNNIQPRLSKIGKSLSFQNNKSISSDANGFALTNNDGTAANLSTGDLNSVSINASGNLKVEGHRTELDTDLVTAKDNKIFLNSKSEKELQGGGIYLGEGIGTLVFTITGLDTDTVSVHYEKSFLCSGVNITANGNLYGFDIDDCSSFFMIADGLQSNQEFTNNFEVIASGADLIISVKTGTINVVSFLGVHNKKIEYNNGWQFNDGVTVDTHTIADSTLRVIGTESVVLDSPTLLANDSYVPNQDKSLVTKDYVDNSNNTYDGPGISLSNGYIDINIKNSLFNKTIVLPTILYTKVDMSIVDFSSQDYECLLQIEGNVLSFTIGEDQVYSKNLNYLDILSLVLRIEDGIVYLYNGTSLLFTHSIENIDYDSFTILDTTGVIYVTGWFTYITTAKVDINRGLRQKSFLFDPNVYCNLCFTKKYDNQKLLDSKYKVSARTTGTIVSQEEDLNTITFESE